MSDNRRLHPRERIETGHWIPPWLRHEHEARDAWAAARCAGLAVLDCVSGNAYGARMLLESGASPVCAFDLAYEAAREANVERVLNPSTAAQRPPSAADGLRPRPTFAVDVADATRLPFADAVFDLFVSFETIEHVADTAAYLAEARRVVRNGGAFLCSTPNRRLTNAGIRITDRPFNPFHVREYTLPELRAALETAFDDIEWLGQSFFAAAYANALNAIGRRARHRPRPLPSRSEPEVLIALCR